MTGAGAHAREDGRGRVITTLLRRGPVGRADLARYAGLAPSTVTGLVATLQADGLVTEGERIPAAQGPGRPTTLIALHRSAGLVVGLDFGKRHFTVAVSDLAHEMVAEQRVEHEADLPAAEQVSRARSVVDQALAGIGADRSSVVGMAAGIPGPVHRATGHLGDSTILPGWVDLTAGETLRAAFERAVLVDNDANIGGLAEWTWGAARGSDHVVYVKLSTGIGGGLVINGQPFVGFGGTAGELGHIRIDPDGPVCRCGRRGCLESVTGSALIIDAVRATHAGVDTVADVLELARAGEESALDALTHCGTAVGTALGAVCNVLNPEIIVLGGELAAAGPIVAAPLVASLAESAVRSAYGDVDVRLGELGDRAEVLGAVALALRGCGPADLLS